MERERSRLDEQDALRTKLAASRARSMTPGASSTAPRPSSRLSRVDSTQHVALALAEAGAPDRTVVVAEFQTADAAAAAARGTRHPAPASSRRS